MVANLYIRANTENWIFSVVLNDDLNKTAFMGLTIDRKNFIKIHLI